MVLCEYEFGATTVSLCFKESVTADVELGWGATITYLSYYMVKNDDIDAIWTAVTIGLVIWFIEDVFVSLMFGAIYNVVFNLEFLVLFLVPIIGRRMGN